MNFRSHVSFLFLLFPLKSQHHATFLTISRQIRIYKSCDQLPCAYLNTQGSSPSGTPLKRIDDSFQHYNEVFVENAKFCAIFRCFGLVDFPSFSNYLIGNMKIRLLTPLIVSIE
ncbi:hypothetical protein T07_6122 [Trichinella nelsoni]|uniref:Uncharacterized protein n=1 Tax=Trichinella nelsoni TaxID=6336 RepID=A0A0V0SI64_9BILA|nr:hypothetical protein T07_6122 [Trichinella nelsoni]